MQARTQTDGSFPQRWITAGAAAAVGLITALTFWPVLRFDFVHWDDDINITQNALLTAPWSWDPVKRMFAGEQTLRFEPLHWLLFHAMHDVFGFDPVAWHALNLLLHVGAAVLVFLVIRRTLAMAVPNASPVRWNFAAVGAAILWAVHPLRAEVVGWATASTYSQATIFLLISFGCYLRATRRIDRSATTGKSVPIATGTWLVTSWLMAAAAYASYPIAVAYPFWLLVADAWLLRPRAGQLDAAFPVTVRASVNRAIVFAVPAIAAMALTVWARFATPGIFNVAPTLDSAGVSVRGAMALASFTYFAGHLIWPGYLTPSIAPLVLTSSAMATIVSGAAIAVLGLLVTWRLRKRWPGLPVVVLGAMAVSVPCLGLTERPTWPVDRYAYLVDVIFVAGAAAAWLVWSVQAGRRGFAAVNLGIAVVLIFAAVAGRRQVMIWRDTGALMARITGAPDFREDARQATHVYLLWARFEQSQGRAADADEHIRMAREMGLAAMRQLAERGDYERALAVVGELEPYFNLTPVMRREKADWLLHTNRPAIAAAELRIVAQAMPDDARTRELLNQAEAAVKR